MKLILASNNPFKAEEIRTMIGNEFELLTMKQAGFDLDIPEPYDTLEENASAKSRTIYALCGSACFSEDTGLEVEILNGKPGVHSARYAGNEKSFENNIQKLLDELSGHLNRKARFRTIISLISGGQEWQFEGETGGVISVEKKGVSGFGYDPVFIPEGATRTFGEMHPEEKNRFSHRRKALEKMIAFMKLHTTLKNNPETR